MGIMSNEEEKRCPLCAEEMDWTDQQLKPCKCGYEVCVWCWHHIMDMAEKDATEGRCPACRKPYDKDRIVGLESNFQRVTANNSSRKQKQPKAKQKPNEARKDLSNVRVIQRKMAYIIGLPLSIADEDLLQRKDYFGQYGKVTKVSLSRTAGGTVQQFVNDTCSVYITYSKEEEAVRCIQSVHGYVLDGMFLRASFGTAKYCHAWLRNMPCNNVGCLYLHNIGADEDSFGKDEIAAVHTRNRVEEIVGAAQYLHKRSGSMLPPPVDEHLNHRSASVDEPVFSTGVKDLAYSAVASSDQKDVIVRPSKHMTSFVDILNSSSDKDMNSVTEGDMLNLCSDISSVHIDNKSEPSRTFRSKLYSDPFTEPSRIHPTEQPNKEQSSENRDILNDGYNEKRFQSLTKSDRIYKCSKSFSNEEIVEHLRRLDDDSVVDDDENSAAVENSIISNILSMDFDGCDDVALNQTVAGFFEGKDGSSWNLQNSDQSRFSFANEREHINQDYGENRDSIYKPQYHASRAHNATPPGFSKPPPGFSSCMGTEQAVSAGSGRYMKTSSSNNHYRMPSIGNLSNDFIDVGRGKSSCFDTRSSSFDDETKLWLLMQQQQQSATHNHEPRFSQTSFTQQHHTPQFSQTSRLVDQRHQGYTQQQYLQPKFANGHMITNGYQLDEAQQVNSRSEVGLDKLYPGYSEYMFQRMSSDDLYTRVFGL